VTRPAPRQDAERPKLPVRRVPGEVGWKLDEQGSEVSVDVEPGLPLRLLSIVPFLFVALIGIVAMIGWIVIVVLGGGKRDPIWVWIGHNPARDAVPQVALAVGIGLAVLGIVLLSMWAAMHGLARSAGRLFWGIAEGVFSALGFLLLLGRTMFSGFMKDIALSGGEWYFAFGFVVFAMFMVALRRRRSKDNKEDDADG
jgi:hypothetical protein